MKHVEHICVAGHTFIHFGPEMKMKKKRKKKKKSASQAKTKVREMNECWRNWIVHKEYNKVKQQQQQQQRKNQPT